MPSHRSHPWEEGTTGSFGSWGWTTDAAQWPDPAVNPHARPLCGLERVSVGSTAASAADSPREWGQLVASRSLAHSVSAAHTRHSLSCDPARGRAWPLSPGPGLPQGPHIRECVPTPTAHAPARLGHGGPEQRRGSAPADGTRGHASATGQQGRGQCARWLLAPASCSQNSQPPCLPRAPKGLVLLLLGHLPARAPAHPLQSWG